MSPSFFFLSSIANLLHQPTIIKTLLLPLIPSTLTHLTTPLQMQNRRDWKKFDDEKQTLSAESLNWTKRLITSVSTEGTIFHHVSHLLMSLFVVHICPVHSSLPLDFPFYSRWNTRGLAAVDYKAVSIMARSCGNLNRQHGCMYFRPDIRFLRWW